MTSDRKIEQRRTTDLRERSEKQLAATAKPGIDARSPEVVLHELRVHEIELEMQNDELRRTHLALETARDSYVDLYDFAPVGYFTLSREIGRAHV